MINYYLITKPGIILGNMITVAAGFLLASSNEVFHLQLFIATLSGLGLLIASACIFNNYLDKPIDKKMERTKNRPLAMGAVSESYALFFAAALGLMGLALLLVYTNILTTAIALLGFFVYVLLYTLWKVHTIYATAIGSIAGAVPPVIGYTAVSNQLDAGAILFFAMMVLWQMPHFFSIAIMHLDDYAKAKIPVLPAIKGIFRTKIHMAIYIVGFTLASSLLTYFHYTGLFYLLIAMGFSLSWLLLCIWGFKGSNDKRWSHQMFRLSLWLITALSLSIPLEKLGL